MSSHGTARTVAAARRQARERSIGGVGMASEIPRSRVVLRSIPGRLGGKVYLYVPGNWSPGGPLLVTVHGISRNVREHARMFAAYAERCGCAILAPFFARDRYKDYQRLGLEKGGRRSDEFLNRAVDAFGEWTGAVVPAFHLFGFSGGAQFAHRYALFHAGRVKTLVLAAAGWYTWPDQDVTFPLGLGGLPVSALAMQAEWLGLPMLVVVGSEDTQRDDSLRQTGELDSAQGPNRIERGRRFVAAVRQAALQHGLESHAEFELLHGVDHDFVSAIADGRLAERALQFMGLTASPIPGDPA